MTYAPPMLSATDYESFEDLLRAYSPFGPLRTLLTLYRPGLGIGGYSGSAESFSLDHVLARTLGLSGFNAGLDRQIYGGGKGLSMFSTVASTAGEAVERMLGSFAFLDSIGSSSTKAATHDEMLAAGRRCLGPEDFHLFDDSQYDEPGFLYERWEGDTPLVWIRGEHALDGDEVWVPAQLVHIFHVMERGEASIGFSSSGGLSTHVDDDSARYHAALELMERDAINLRWYCRIPPARIVRDRAFRDRALNRWFEEAERVDMPVELYEHSLDLAGDVSVVTAIAWDHEIEHSGYFAGGGVGLSTEEAISSAVGELVQSERMIRVPTVAPDWGLSFGISRLFGSPEEMRPTEFSNFIQVIPYYGYRKNRDRLAWYFFPEDQDTVKLSDLPDRQVSDGHEGWKVVEAVCADHGFTPIVYDFTPDLFDRVRLTKVVIPELTPAFPPNLLSLGHPRYRELPARLGLRPDHLSFEDFTDDPLPYP